ncbi:MAG: hypothetical protein UX02_C0002G0151 [Candidatus Moranbacteria bacterium GW2011_GWC1_45_18]|nr:MAG: hypothetical protein UT79_C0001G0310 [Candidatus Moranbacteria bacterium GW2011_GWC2_40_12]KKT33934.1 MAG: hypothetical protein UW19_C0004G0064 [Candidatus Moranbacteria bacterium GW2011_GWF2_44_10]KKT99832.1 MAG: hypothetical protein UX02_C0002G0151 [Candidatus Moranbacteria bacterium GW2011_GWC1_45_18]OGI23932.1 MAG: hypothetical protein A2194_00135 [Candidatus Moranbacteria bacterium RIFOXYA1_FULL_44_8]OGI35009.1 MAG: hypothetical protein A2407_00620 [Candidatus Moranbacteria bacteri
MSKGEDSISFKCTAKCGNKNQLGFCKIALEGKVLEIVGKGKCNCYSVPKDELAHDGRAKY